MTREQIEKAAKEYAEENPWYLGETFHESDIRETEEKITDAFRIGAQWRINAVWHDASEIPQHSGILIVICKDGKAVLCGPNNSNWETTVKIFHIVRWAYLDDLLPERKEGTE